MTTSRQQIQFRQRNRTYYADLERLHQLLVPPGLRVLEVGCGTGDLLAHLQPAHGVGIELDPEVATSGSSSCLFYTSPSPRDQRGSRMPSSA